MPVSLFLGLGAGSMGVLNLLKIHSAEHIWFVNEIFCT